MRAVASTTASVIAVIMTAAFLPGAGLGSSAAAAAPIVQKIPAGLAAAIHARLGAGAMRSSSTTSFVGDPFLGTAVSLSADGTTALVGAPGVGGGKGAVYVFRASDAGSWSSSKIPTATLTKRHAIARRDFGQAVALSADGTTAFVGAPVDPDISGPGAIYVFHVSGEDAWSSSSKPTATLTVTNSAYLGSALALSTDGTTLLVGAPFVGAAYVFHVSSEDAWASTSTPAATLTLDDTEELTGASVAISGDGTTALITDYANGGGAAVYHVSDASAWTSTSTPTAILTDANDVSDDSLGLFGLALSGDGTVALLGAPDANSGTGMVDVFHASGEAAWATTSTPTATLTVAGAAHDALGLGGLAVSTDGTTALLSAPGANADRGAAYIFRASSAGAWSSSSTPTATLTNSGGHPEDILGSAGVLTPDGTTALVGAPWVRSQTGAADIFHVSDASAWTTISTPHAVLTDDALAACVVPKLKGLKLGMAKHALSVGRCSLGKVMRVYPPVRRGNVVSQSRKPGRRLAIGARVNVTIGK
jgi:hypothetical protein